MKEFDIERTAPITMDIGGSEISVSFALEPNTMIALLVKKALIESFQLQNSNKS